MTVPGAMAFARFAVPPNGLGYCGPEAHEQLIAYGRGAQAADAGLVELARGFEGAWPYLELLAGAAGVDDPLDHRVVEAYWLGNRLLDRVTANDWGWHLVDRFGPRAGAETASITRHVGAGALPTHAFHVFCVYPWVGLLREGTGGPPALSVIEQCRIGWGTVVDTEGPNVVVAAPELEWGGDRLTLGPPRSRALVDLIGVDDLAVGDVVAHHWGQVCQRLSPTQLHALVRTTHSQLALTHATGV